MSGYEFNWGVNAEKARAHLEEQDRLIAVDDAVIEELRDLVDRLERESWQRKAQRAEFIKRFVASNQGDTHE
jgi:hypothetical protein